MSSARLEKDLSELEAALNGNLPPNASIMTRLEAVGRSLGELTTARLAKAKPRRRASDVESEVILHKAFELPEDDYDADRPDVPDAPVPPRIPVGGAAANDLNGVNDHDDVNDRDLNDAAAASPPPPPPPRSKMLKVSPAKAKPGRHRNVVVLDDYNSFLRELV